MRWLLLMSLTFLTGCGSEADAHTPTYNVKGFEHYVALFVEQGAVHGKTIVIKDLVIRVRKVQQNPKSDAIVLAVCWFPKDEHTTPVIDVDPKAWSESTMIGRLILLFHEMGHCVLRRNHEDNYYSIMNSYILPLGIFIANESTYMDELFNPQKYSDMKKNSLYKKEEQCLR